MSAAHPKRAKNKRKLVGKLPDLAALGYAFADARALVAIASAVVNAGWKHIPVENVLRLAVETLDRVDDQLEEADTQLYRFRKAHKIGGAA